MKNMNISFLLILSSLCISSSGLNILALFPHPGKSHFMVFETLLQALAEKGHNVTVISPFPQKEPLPRYRDISIEKETDIILNKFNLKSFNNGYFSHFWAMFMIKDLTKKLCLNLRSKPLQDFIKSNEKFDLIITEIFNNDCYLGFAHKYQIPVIGLCPNVIMSYINTYFGNPSNPSYIPNVFLGYSDKMTFWERVQNTLTYMIVEIMYKLYILDPSYEEAKIHFGEDLPPLDEIQRNISVMLVNTHFSLNFPKPLVPNVIEVGGMFVRGTKKLPQNLEKFISESKHKVIYFSMGSMISGHTFPEEKRKAFLNVFSKLKQRIVWKWETDSMPDQPSNVLIQKWMPQKDVLCHPNVIAFISHGGLLSTTETVHCGKPAIIMPQYGDQFINAKAMEIHKTGIVLQLSEVTEDIILDSINQILKPSFRENSEKLSKRFLDRPNSALETAIYWVEYVARHKGAPHLRSAAVDLPWYTYFLVDVILFLIGCLFVIFVAMYFICILTYSLLFRNKIYTIKPAKIKKQ